MTAHNWQPVFAEAPYGSARCTHCGVYRVYMWAEEGRFSIRYSPPNADIKNTLRWRKKAPPCKQITITTETEEPQS